MSQAVINSGAIALAAPAWPALASVAAIPATRPHSPAAHAYRAYAATATFGASANANKHFMGGGSWSSLR